MRAVLLPAASYLALPAAKGLPKDKPWLEVPGRPGPQLGKQLGPVVDQMRASFDPAQGLGLLGPPAGSTEVGPATVEGVPTTQHQAIVDLRRATAWSRTGGPRAVPVDAGRRRSDPGVRAVAGPAGCRRKVQHRHPDRPGPLLGDRDLPWLGREGHIAAPGKQVFDADRSRAEPGSAICCGRCRRVPSPLPQTAGRRSRKGAAEGPASAGGPRR